MARSILNVGRQEDEALFCKLATTGNKRPSIRTVADPAQARMWANVHQPDMAFVDVRGLNGKGIQFIRQMRMSPDYRDMPMLAILNESDHKQRDEALLAGADALMTAPLDPRECHMRILNLLTLSAQRRLRRHDSAPRADGIDAYVSARECDALWRIAAAGELSDESTRAHVFRMGKISRCVAEGLRLPASECELIEVAAPMHDIGKIGIPDSILCKRGPLTESERKTMETHAQLGYDVLKNSRSPYLQYGAEIALGHHEKFDGSGYPHGKRGDEIPLCARIVAVADVYDALAHRRPYKEPWPLKDVFRYLNEQKGRHFDPQCVDALATQIKSPVSV